MAHWLYNWLDSHDIRTHEKARTATQDPKLLSSLHNLASRNSPTKSGSDESDDIVAGEGLDLGSPYSCYHPKCADERVAQVFSRIALYFDHVVISDPFLYNIRNEPEKFERQLQDGQFTAYVELLLHLRAIGADPYLRFQETHEFDFAQIDTHIEQLHLENRKVDLQNLPSIIADECEISIERPTDGPARVKIAHSDLAKSFKLTVKGNSAQPSDEGLREYAIQVVSSILVSTLLKDLSSAKSVDAPLGISATTHQRILDCHELPTSDDIAFQLRLPTIEQIPVQELLKVRGDNGDAFRQFKHALRKAIVERRKSSPQQDPKRLSVEIFRDVIQPELDRIEARLRAAESALKKKSLLAVGVGAIATTCGMIAGAPILPLFTAALAGALGVAATAGAKDIDERQQISQSDMYYLWRLTKGKTRENAG